MSELKLELETRILLPEVEDERDRCLDRLEYLLQNKPGIERVHTKRGEKPLQICLHYDPNIISLRNVERIAKRAGASISNRYRHRIFPIEGMDCSDCALVVEHSLSRLEGVMHVSVNYAAQTLSVAYDSHLINQANIDKRVASLGYRIPARGVRGWYNERRKLLFSLVGGLALLVGWIGERYLNLPIELYLGLYLLAYISTGYDVILHAYKALKLRRFDTDFLMIVAALGAAVIGAFAEGGLLLFLFSLGHALEERTMDRARHAIRSLSDLAPRTALVLQNGTQVEKPADELNIEDIVIVKPGTRFPVDGEVVAGSSSVNQGPVTGESMPVDKDKGDKVFAGSINGPGALEVKVIKLARDSTLARISRMVAEAQAQKSPTQRVTEKFMGYFVPLVLISDLAIILIPPLFGIPFFKSFTIAMTLLVATSPCALVLGTPAAILSGVAQSARNGVLIKGGVHLENLGRLKAIAFDKTGTITSGHPKVTDIVVLDPEITEEEVLKWAAAVESRSTHPLAEAIIQAAVGSGLKVQEVTQATSLPGLGAKGVVSGDQVWVGSPDIIINERTVDDESVPNNSHEEVPEELPNQVVDFEKEGKTPILVSRNGKIIGLIAVADTIRPNINQYLDALKKLGLQRSIMLTGDNSQVAEHISEQVGIREFLASLMPQDKVNAIKKLVANHQYVAMVGDGVNDAPALASATVGIAMGGAGTDVALETADVVLIADDLSKLPFAVGLGRETKRIIRQNLVIALGVILGLVVFALSGEVGIGTAIVFHEGSTLVVVLNSLRLLKYHL